jgi:hypothetical protein
VRPPERRRPLRRSKRSLGARLRRFWILGFLVAIALTWGGWRLATLPAFRLHDLAVTGTVHVTRTEIVARAAIDPHENVWLLDRSAIERRIAAIPYVLSARVHRQFVGNLWIDVAERRPEACVRDGAGHAFLVDSALRVLETVCTPIVTRAYDVRAHLGGGAGTFLRDPEIVALQSDANALDVGDERYRAFDHDAYGELEATMQSGIRVRFGGDDDLPRKQRLIEPILAELGPRLGDVRSLDVRAPSTPVVEYRK